MAETAIEDLAGMQSETDEERQTVSTGDAAESPEADEPYNQNVVPLAADPEELALMQDIYLSIQEQNTLIAEQTENNNQAMIGISMILGIIIGILFVKGLWVGGHR